MEYCDLTYNLEELMENNIIGNQHNGDSHDKLDTI